MNDETKQHLENTLLKIRPLFEKAAELIDALKPGEKIPATELAKTLAKECGMTGPQLYPTLKFLLNDEYPGVAIRRGAHGGIVKLGAEEAAPEVTETEPDTTTE